jgi:type IV secretory pathway VirB4 component
VVKQPSLGTGGKRLFKLKRQDKKQEDVVVTEDDIMSFKDVLAPDAVDEHETHMELGRNYTSTICIKDYPKRVYGNWLSELRRFQGNVSISTHLSKTSSEDIIKHLNGAIPELESRTVSAKEAKKRQAKIEQQDAERLLDKLIGSDSNGMFKVYMYIHLHGDSYKALQRLQGRIYTVLRRAKLKGTLVKHRAHDAFRSSLPMMENEVPEVTNRNMDAEAASSLFPFDDSEIFIQSDFSVIKGKNLTTGSVVLVDHFAMPNHNEFIAGTSGMAKTTTMVSDILRHWVQGVKIFITDPEGEFKNIVEGLGGTVIVVSNLSDTIINPLEMVNPEVTDTKGFDVEADDEEPELVASLLHQKIQRLKILFGNIKKDLTQVEESLLEEVLINTYRRDPYNITEETDISGLTAEDFPTFSDLYEEIEKLPASEGEKLEDFKIVFRTYVRGSHSKMFNGHTNVDLSNDLIDFDLRYLEDESDLKKSAMYNVITFLWDEITKDKTTPKRLYIDEAHVLADPDHPILMKFVFQLYKRIRKYFGGATVATQQLSDYLSASDGKRNYGAAIIENSSTKLILGMENMGIQDLIDKAGLGLSQEEINIIKRKQKAKGIYFVGAKRVYLNVIQTQEEMRLFDAARYEKTFGENAKVTPTYDISGLKRGVI